jgi:hypothetical protein
MTERVDPTDQAPPAGEAIHLPGPSMLPALVALGITIAIVGVVLNWFVFGAGIAITLYTIIRWVREMRADIADLPLEHDAH